MKTRRCPLWVVVFAAVLFVQGCSFPAVQEELLLEAAKKKFKQGDYAGSVRDCSQLIAMEPEDAAPYHLRGLGRQALSDLRGALQDFDSAAEHQPWNDVVFRSRVNARLALLDSLEGPASEHPAGDPVLFRMQIVTTRIILTRDLDGLLRIDPEDAWAHGERGTRRFELGDAQGAIEDFTEVLRLEPEAGWAYYDRGLAEAALEDYPAAITDFTRVLTEDRSDGWAFYQRGLARIYAGDHDIGCSDLRRALDLGVEESESAMEELCR